MTAILPPSSGIMWTVEEGIVVWDNGDDTTYLLEDEELALRHYHELTLRNRDDLEEELDYCLVEVEWVWSAHANSWIPQLDY